MAEAKPVTESPWFWVLLFSLFAALLVLLMSGRYGRRQAGIERKYQAHQRTAADSTDVAGGEAREFSSEQQTLIPLWPLGVACLVVAAGAGLILYRTIRFSAEGEESAS